QLWQSEGQGAVVGAVAFAPDGKTLASASEDGQIRFWAADTGQQQNAAQADRHAIRALAFSPGGKTLASGDDRGRIRLWDPATGKERLAGGSRLPFAGVAFAADGQTLLTADSHRVLQWEAGTGKELHRLALPHGRSECLALSPDGRVLAVAREDHEIRLLESG